METQCRDSFNLCLLLCYKGTTCATVLTQAILTEGCKSVAAGVNVMDLRSGINMAIDAVVSDLKSRAVMISTPEEITQVNFESRFIVMIITRS